MKLLATSELVTAIEQALAGKLYITPALATQREIDSSIP